jgi:hypothetical protein
MSVLARVIKLIPEGCEIRNIEATGSEYTVTLEHVSRIDVIFGSGPTVAVALLEAIDQI